MRRAAILAGVIISCVLIGVSVAISFEFGFQMGTTYRRALIYGTATAAADLLKPFLPFFIVWGWQAGRGGVVIAGCGLVILTTLMSVASGIGFASENRSGTVWQRETINIGLQDAERQLADNDREQEALGRWRPVAVVQVALNAALAQPVYTAQRTRGTVGQLSSNCSVVDAGTRAACAEIAITREELARAVAGERLQQSRGEIAFRIERLRQRGGGREIDPQATAMARLMPFFDVGQVRSGLALLVALLIEAGSSLGLYVVTGHGAWKFSRPRVPDDEPTPLVAMPGTPEVCSVEAYWLARLFPDSRARVALDDVYIDYLRYCANVGGPALSEGQFTAAMRAICSRIGMPLDDGELAGTRIGAQRLTAEVS